MSVGNMDDLNDLGSFDSDGMKGPASPSSPRVTLPFYNPVGLTIGETSPGLRSVASSDMGSSYARNQSHSVNAVHMHSQENAKIPVLNQSVDRTNSSHTTRTTTRHRPDETMSSNPAGFSMAELFLSKESKHRHSLNLNYESFASAGDDFGFGGARRRFSGDSSSSKGGGGDGKNSALDETQMEIDALTAAIDPTPWSEIERKIHNDQAKAQIKRKQQQQQSQYSIQQRGAAAGSAKSHSNNYGYYPYRQIQLPIPERSSPPLPLSNSGPPPPVVGSATMAQAVATAAAIAATGSAAAAKNETNRVQPQTSPPMNGQRGPPPPLTAKPPAPPYTKAQQTPLPPAVSINNKNQNNSTQHFNRQRASYAAPHHGAAHATSRASVLAAANQKSRYGFGGNHTVPSVPAPPPVSSSSATTASNAATIAAMPNFPDLHNHSGSVGGQTTPPNSGAAYERKKQRAKDARVKLNESIESLSVAMSLAGSQSKQRKQVLLNNTMATPTNNRSKTIQISGDCARLAEQAKKWDRPSFVGTAASLIQGLNSQCESLMREMLTLQEQLDRASGGSTSPSSAANNGRSELTSHPDHKRHDGPTSVSNGDVHHATKRLKSMQFNDRQAEPSSVNNIQHVEVTTHEKTVYGNVAKMLDPISLTRCPCVSRSWRDMEVFDDNNVWLDLAVKRFGVYNVRQWSENVGDGDADPNSPSRNKALYEMMNGANVMPHIKQEGVAMLGDAKIPGRISGWVFMVERSNGETLRSVKKEPGSGPGIGSYQSRPVVELKIIIQNTGMASHPVIIKNQHITVDISTRRTGGELKEIYWDDRFSKLVKNRDGTIRESPKKNVSSYEMQQELCRLDLFEVAVLEVHINARGCSTTSKFQQRSNFTKILVCLDGTTVPMVIPFLRDGSHRNH